MSSVRRTVVLMAWLLVTSSIPFALLGTLFHAGVEYVPLPSSAQRRRCQFFIESGADAVICQHSHIAGPIERYKQGWISYGTGDFLSTTQHAAISRSSLPAYAIRVRLTEHDKQISWEIFPLRRAKDGSGSHCLLTGDEKSVALTEFDRLNESALNNFQPSDHAE